MIAGTLLYFCRGCISPYTPTPPPPQYFPSDLLMISEILFSISEKIFKICLQTRSRTILHHTSAINTTEGWTFHKRKTTRKSLRFWLHPESSGLLLKFPAKQTLFLQWFCLQQSYAFCRAMVAGWAKSSKTVSAATDAGLKTGSDMKHRRSN